MTAQERTQFEAIGNALEALGLAIKTLVQEPSKTEVSVLVEAPKVSPKVITKAPAAPKVEKAKISSSDKAKAIAKTPKVVLIHWAKTTARASYDRVYMNGLPAKGGKWWVEMVEGKLEVCSKSNKETSVEAFAAADSKNKALIEALYSNLSYKAIVALAS